MTATDIQPKLPGRLLRALMALALAFGAASLYAAASPPRAYASEGYVSRVDAPQADPGNLNPSGTPATSAYMEISAGGEARMAICAAHEKSSPAVGTGVHPLGTVGNDDIRRALFYGYGGPENRGYSLVRTATAVSAANGHMATSLAWDMIGEVRGLPPAPDSFVVTLWTSGGPAQDLVTWDYHPYGGLQFTKASDNPSVTAGNPCYSLAGAVYGVYSDAACTSSLGTMATDANGYAALDDLAAGSTAYVKEIKASPGYLLDPQVYAAPAIQEDARVDVNGGTLREAPGNDPVGVLVGKVDADTGKMVSQGASSLAGAEFTLDYYAGYYPSADEARASGAPTRQWVYATRDDGVIHFEDAPISGDPVYTDPDTHLTTLPYGTYVYRETKAPTGYLLPDSPTVFATRVVYDGSLPDGEAPDYAPYTRVEGDRFPTEGNAGDSTTLQKEQVMRGDVSLTKVAAHAPATGDLPFMDVLAGVDFTITNDNDGPVKRPDGILAEKGEVVTTITTDDRGYAETTGGALAYGTYTLHEVESTVPPGYARIKDFNFTIAENGEQLYYVLKDGTGTALRIVKTDADTGKQIAGYTTFRILDKDFKPVVFTKYYPSVTQMTAFTTDATGSCVLPEPLNGGGQYYIQEIKAPEGYVLSDELVPFVADGTGGWTWDSPLTVTLADRAQKGVITVSKTDAETGRPVAAAGIGFDVKAKADIVTNDGTVHAYAGATVARIATGADGAAATPELYLGSYEVIETKAPEGYALDSEPVAVNLAYADQTVAVTAATVDVADDPTRIDLDKTAADTGRPLAGVEFAWWDKADEHVVAHGAGKAALAVALDASDSIAVSKVEAVRQAGNEAGKAEHVELAPDAAGVYQAGNVEPGTYDISVAYAYNGDAADAVHADALATAEVDAEHFQKLYSAVGTTGMDDEGKAATTWQTTQVPAYADAGKLHHETTDEAGRIRLAYLAPGTYGFAEEEALPGYVLDMTPRYMTVAADGTVEGSSTGHVAVANDPTHAAIAKVDAATGEPLAGAELELYAAPAPGAADDAGNPASYGALIDKWTSADEPHVLANLPAGDYIIHELSAPEKYYVGEDMPIAVDGTTSEVQAFTFANDYTRTDVAKTDAETGKALGGAWLAVRDAKGDWIDPRALIATPAGEKAPELNEIAFAGGAVQGHVALGASDAIAWVLHDAHGDEVKSWAGAAPPAGEVLAALSEQHAGCTLDKVVTPDEGAAYCWQTTDEPVRFEGLAPGDYTLVEISAPEGYELAEDVPFAVASSGEVAGVSMADTRIPAPPAPPMPRTGDVIGGVMAALGAAVACSCAVGFAVRRRAKGDEDKSAEDKEG